MCIRDRPQRGDGQKGGQHAEGLCDAELEGPVGNPGGGDGERRIDGGDQTAERDLPGGEFCLCHVYLPPMQKKMGQSAHPKSGRGSNFPATNSVVLF